MAAVLLVALAACAPAKPLPGSLPTPDDFCLPDFESSIAPLSKAHEEAMRGVVWKQGCPVALSELRRVELAHWTPSGERATGILVVHESVANDVVTIFRALWQARFPVERMEPVERYHGDDERSMAANNTSSFNCRPVAGSTRFSRHAHGDAIDLNPRQNPWVRGDEVQPANARRWVDRSKVEPGMIVEGGAAVSAFEAAGWHWGGRWKRVKDYQHFSKTGR